MRVACKWNEVAPVQKRQIEFPVQRRKMGDSKTNFPQIGEDANRAGGVTMCLGSVDGAEIR
ncbi:hypothetical protein SDC9_160320 [bioreactor metagenome]|uniref:Uncharacterized protein n=1 Tax=bioreactor metagenome TaxID=1076179 RepID=A0A645FGC1_9ZZZZ